MTKRILTVALAALMLLSLTFVASAQTQVSQINVRGSVVDAHNANSDMSWNYQNFAGFFYDLKDNISTETMIIKQNVTGSDIVSLNTSRTIPEKALIYTTVPEPVQYKMNEQQNVLVGPSPGSPTYDVVGWRCRLFG